MIHIYTSSQKWPLSITKYAINKIIHVYPFPHHILYPYMLTYGYDNNWFAINDLIFKFTFHKQFWWSWNEKESHFRKSCPNWQANNVSKFISNFEISCKCLLQYNRYFCNNLSLLSFYTLTIYGKESYNIFTLYMSICMICVILFIFYSYLKVNYFKF